MEDIDIKKMKEQQDILSRSINADRLIIESLRKENDSLHADIEKRKQNLDDVYKNISYKQKEIAVLNDELSSLLLERADITGNIEKQKNELLLVKKNVEQEYINERNLRTIEIVEIDAKIKEKSGEMILVSGKLSDLESLYNEYTYKIVSQESLIASYDDQIKLKSITLSNLSNNESELNKKLSELDSIIASKEIDIVTADSKLKVINSDLDTLHSTIDSLRSEIKSLENKKEEKLSEYTLLERKAFSIIQRENTLNEREEFIKEQYNRAGIEYGKN